MKGLLASQLCSRQTGGIDCAKTDALGLDAKVVRSAKWHEQEAQQTKQNGAAKRRRKAAQTLSRNYPSDITREALPEYVQKMYEDFFMRASYVPSGAKDNLRHVSVLKHELEEELYAMYPAMLRDLSQAHRDELFEHVDRPSNDTYTVLQASILTAEYWASKDGFTPEEEVSHRRDVAVKKYRAKLNHSTWKKRGHSMGPPQKAGPKKTDDLRKISTWDPSKFEHITPIDPCLFWQVLANRKVKYTFNVNPTICELCQNGPGQQAAVI